MPQPICIAGTEDENTTSKLQGPLEKMLKRSESGYTVQSILPDITSRMKTRFMDSVKKDLIRNMPNVVRVSEIVPFGHNIYGIDGNGTISGSNFKEIGFSFFMRDKKTQNINGRIIAMVRPVHNDENKQEYFFNYMAEVTPGSWDQFLKSYMLKTLVNMETMMEVIVPGQTVPMILFSGGASLSEKTEFNIYGSDAPVGINGLFELFALNRL